MDIEPQQEEEQQQHEFAWVMANSNNTLILTHHEQPMGRLRVAKVVSGVAWPRPRGLWSRSLAHHVWWHDPARRLGEDVVQAEVVCLVAPQLVCPRNWSCTCGHWRCCGPTCSCQPLLRLAGPCGRNIMALRNLFLKRTVESLY